MNKPMKKPKPQTTGPTKEQMEENIEKK